jgi:hypothetical protein
MRLSINASQKRMLIVSGSTLAILCTLAAIAACSFFGIGSAATYAATWQSLSDQPPAKPEIGDPPPRSAMMHVNFSIR